MRLERSALHVGAICWMRVCAGCGKNPLGDGLPDEIDCASCHGGPANAAPPLSLAGGLETADPAVGAHQRHLVTGTIRSAIDVAGGKHIDGVVDKLDLACNGCHGNDVNAAPPVSTSGSSDT